jgi:GT2 family glycosyltransferase
MNRYDIKHNYKFEYTNAPVDVIIPFHGQYGLAAECIKSLVSKTLGQIYTITLVDDASPNENFIADLKKEKLKNTPIQFIRLTEQKGFGGALKARFDATQNPWVLFLHADCQIVQTDWLLHMLQTMQKLKKQGVKLVSAKLNDGGSGAFDPAVIGDKTFTDDVIVEEPLPLVCTLINRHLFENIRGFVKEYPYGWFEDEELFWRMKLMGFKQAICGKSFVHHEGGATIRSLLLNPNIKSQMEQNQKTYINDIQSFMQRHSIK